MAVQLYIGLFREILMKKIFLVVMLVMLTQIAAADELAVSIDGKMSSVVVKGADGDVTIMRDQNQDATINSKYAKATRACYRLFSPS